MPFFSSSVELSFFNVDETISNLVFLLYLLSFILFVERLNSLIRGNLLLSVSTVSALFVLFPTWTRIPFFSGPVSEAALTSSLTFRE